MNTNILKSNLGKQILGAGAGMAIAAVIYLGLNHVSDLNIKGVLVSTDTVTENSGEVSVNSKNVDEDTLRRIQARAVTVANQLENASSSAQAQTPTTENAAARRTQRQFVTQVKQDFENAPTYINDPNVVMTEEQRNAIRANGIRPQFTEASASSVSPLTFSNPPEAEAAVTDVPQGDDGLHSGAQVADAQSTKLPNSGLGLNLIVLAALAAAFIGSKTTWREQVALRFRSVQASILRGVRLV
jgi:hypothetical protein